MIDVNLVFLENDRFNNKIISLGRKDWKYEL